MLIYLGIKATPTPPTALYQSTEEGPGREYVLLWSLELLLKSENPSPDNTYMNTIFHAISEHSKTSCNPSVDLTLMTIGAE